MKELNNMKTLAINKNIYKLSDLTLTQKANLIEIIKQYECINELNHDLIKLIQKDTLTRCLEYCFINEEYKPKTSIKDIKKLNMNY